MMLNTSCRRVAAPAPARALRAAPVRRSVVAHADGGFDLDKVVSDLPVPVEYAYAGLAWGALPALRPCAIAAAHARQMLQMSV